MEVQEVQVMDTQLLKEVFLAFSKVPYLEYSTEESSWVLLLLAADGTSGVARFSAESPEYVSLLLQSGTLYWENEWSPDGQVELAQRYAAIARRYLSGGSVSVLEGSDSSGLNYDKIKDISKVTAGLHRDTYYG
jgi:hypothetical protein